MTGLGTTETVIHKVLITLICASFFSLALGTAPLTICSSALLAVWLLSGTCYQNRLDWLGQSWLVPVALLMVLPWLGMLWSSSPEHKVAYALRSYYWLFSFVAASTIKSEQALRKVLVCFIAGITITIIPILLYSFSLLPSMYFMTRIATQGYITYSLLIVIAVILLARFFNIAHDVRCKVAICFLILLLLLTVTQLNGRSGYLTLVLLSPWIFIAMFGRQRLLIVGAAFLTIFVLLVSSHRVRDRVAVIPEEIKKHQAGDRAHTPVGARLEMWQDAWTVFVKHPVAGVGTAGLWHETDKMHPGQGLNHPHNSYLFIATSYGIMGLLIYGWLTVITLRRAWQSRHTLPGHTILAFLSVMMIGSLTDTQILSVASGIALGFIVGIPTPASTCAS